MINNGLKPCPFCGGSAVINTNVGYIVHGVPYSYITCNKCRASFTLYYSHDAEKIREAWNKRVNGDACIEDAGGITRNNKEEI